MSVLLCMQFFPEEVKFYMVEPTPEEIKILKRAHNHFINTEELDDKTYKAVMYAMAATSEYKSGWDDVPKSVVGKWVGNKLDLRRPTPVSARLIVTGMYM